MRILSLDLATRLGWCAGDVADGDPVSGWHQLPKGTGDDVGAFLAAYHSFLIPKIKDTDPTLVVFEAPINAQGVTQMSTLMKLWGLCSHTEFVGDMKGIETRQIYASTWKKGFTGSGGTKKPKSKAQAADYPVIRVCHELGWEHVTDDNEADAIGIWVYAARLINPSAASRFDPLMRAAQFQPAA